MGETRVDLLHLLEDLRDAYPGSLEETILTEIVANSLDSGARAISFRTDPGERTLVVLDDGSGMLRRALSRYHDIAATTKTRGQGIGFAGVGIKLGLLLCDEVVTETRRGKTHVASRWHLASRHRAPWKWIEPLGFVSARGTAVCLKPTNALSPLLDPGFIEGSLRRHFQPLFEPAFGEILAPSYGDGVRFELNGRALLQEDARPTEIARVEVRLPRRRKASASGYLSREPRPLPEDQRGVAVSTLGKVIKRGWDWLGVTPSAPDQIGGLIEVPALAECLTLNKADFIRTGARGATYLAYRKAIQEAVSQQLAAWGDARDTAQESRRRAARPVERDLERVLVEMADDFPLLAALVEHHRGGQRKLPMGGGTAETDARGMVLASVTTATEHETAGAQSSGDEQGATPESSTAAAAGTPETSVGTLEAAPQPAEGTRLPGGVGPRQRTRYGLSIQFESRPGDPELGRLVESTVWVNDAHAAFRRAAASRSEGYHLALAVAMALAPLAVEPVREHGFVTAFLERWGAALDAGRPTRRSRR